MKRAALLIVPVLLAFWACETVPDETSKPGSAPMDKEIGETVPVEAIEPADTKAVEKAREVEHPTEPVFRLDKVSSCLANGVLDTITDSPAKR